MDRLDFLRALPWAELQPIDWITANELFEGLYALAAVPPTHHCPQGLYTAPHLRAAQRSSSP